MFQRILLSILVTFSIAAFAGEPAPDLSKDQNCNQECQVEVKNITHKFHEMLEGRRDPQTFQEMLKDLASKEGFVTWVKEFNFRKTAMNAYRAYQVSSGDPKVKEHVANLAFLFPLSHAVEMSSGPILTTMSAAMGLPDFVTGATAVAGGIISIPGLDPLCIFFYTTYPVSPRLRSSITFLRENTMRAVTFVGSVSGTRALFKRFNSWMFNHWQQRSIESIMVSDAGVTVYADPHFQYSVLFLPWQQDEKGDYFFSGVQFVSPLPSNFTDNDLKRVLKNLPYNVREAILDAREVLSQNLDEADWPFYFSSVDRDQLTVEWAPRSVKPDRSLRTCRELLSSAPKALPPAL